jgi:hypothetical protein
MSSLSLLTLFTTLLFASRYLQWGDFNQIYSTIDSIPKYEIYIPFLDNKGVYLLLVSKTEITFIFHFIFHTFTGTHDNVEINFYTPSHTPPV